MVRIFWITVNLGHELEVDTYKVYTDCRAVRIKELVVLCKSCELRVLMVGNWYCKSAQQTGFANSLAAKEQDLEEVVIFRGFLEL